MKMGIQEWAVAAGLDLGLLVSSPALAFYNPNMGRWLSRDPVQEQGGANLYVFRSFLQFLAGSGVKTAQSPPGLARSGLAGRPRIVMSRTLAKWMLAGLGLCLLINQAQAWRRRHYSDVEIVARAELMVVGKLKGPSLVLVVHTNRDGTLDRWEHLAELRVTEVLKGTNSLSTVPICIHYGLEPVIGGFKSNQVLLLDIKAVYTNYPRDVIELFDTGSSYTTFRPITGDLRTNHIWLLRRGSLGQSTTRLGVFDPEDIQPLERREELLAHLRADAGQQREKPGK